VRIKGHKRRGSVSQPGFFRGKGGKKGGKKKQIPAGKEGGEAAYRIFQGSGQRGGGSTFLLPQEKGGRGETPGSARGEKGGVGGGIVRALNSLTRGGACFLGIREGNDIFCGEGD